MRRVDIEKIKSIINNVIVSGVVVAVGTAFILESCEENKPSDVPIISEFDAKEVGIVDNENIPISYGGEDDSCVIITITNKNDTPIDVKDIIVEVIDYKSLDEFIIENPVGGADASVYYWLCDISKDKKEYYSTYIGTEQDNKEDISGESHLVVEAKGLEQIRVKLRPDTPGLYEVRGSVEYIYNGKKEKEELKKEKFIYDPNNEANYE